MMATQLQPAWPKGHFRLGVALLELRQWVDALDALSRCAAIEPANPLVQEKLQLAADKVQPGMRGAPGIFTWGGGDFGALGHGDTRPAARCGSCLVPVLLLTLVIAGAGPRWSRA